MVSPRDTVSRWWWLRPTAKRRRRDAPPPQPTTAISSLSKVSACPPRPSRRVGRRRGLATDPLPRRVLLGKNVIRELSLCAAAFRISAGQLQ
jgi:hypothetical protein